MPRRPRAIFPGVAHHITQRGNNRQPVFYCNGDRRLYLGLLTGHALQHGTHIISYCLMTNHVHLVVVPECEHSLARTLGRTHSQYAQALNQTRKRSGHLWQNRFFSCPLDASHLENTIRYVELNPVRAGLIIMPWDWPWSSARAHSLEGAKDKVLDANWASHFDGWDYGGWKERLLGGMSDGDTDAVRRATQTGEPLGSREFLRRLERYAGRRLSVLERGRPRKSRSQPDAA